jgi:hypothetical protein
MKPFYLLPLVVLLPALSPAQDLSDSAPIAATNGALREMTLFTNDDIPALRPLKWEKGGDLINGRISEKKLHRMRKSTEEIVFFLQDSCLAGSYIFRWHGEYSAERTGPGWMTRFGLKGDFYCDSSYGNISDKRIGTLRILSNDMSPLLGRFAVNNKAFLTVKAVAAVKDNGQYFEFTIEGEEAAPQRVKALLVAARPDQLPYTLVTRKEYLEEARTELVNDRNRMVADLKEKIPLRSA